METCCPSAYSEFAFPDGLDGLLEEYSYRLSLNLDIAVVKLELELVAAGLAPRHQESDFVILAYAVLGDLGVAYEDRLNEVQIAAEEHYLLAYVLG